MTGHWALRKGLVSPTAGASGAVVWKGWARFELPEAVVGEIVDVRGRSIATYIACRAAEALNALPDGGTVELVTDRDPAVDHDL